MLLDISFFFFNDTATTEIYTLSLHDALPIYQGDVEERPRRGGEEHGQQHGDSQPHGVVSGRSEEHTSELQSRLHLVCRLLLEKKKHGVMTRHPHIHSIVSDFGPQSPPTRRRA